MANISKAINYILNQTGTTQKAFAELCSINVSTLRRAAQGGDPSAEVQLKIERSLSILRKAHGISILDVELASDEKFHKSRRLMRRIDKAFLSAITRPKESFKFTNSKFDELNEPFLDKQNRQKKTHLKEIADAIEDQNPMIRFDISDRNLLKFTPGLNDENDFDTIEALRSEMLVANGPIKNLRQRYAKNPNMPQASLFGPLTNRYDEELSKDPREINYATLYAIGSRLYAARLTASKQVDSGEWPEPDFNESNEIDTICNLHGPLIMASATGRKLVSDSHQYETTASEFHAEEKLLSEFGNVLASETELFEPETIQNIRDLTAPIDNDPQPARSRGMRLRFASSALSVIVGGAAWYTVGGAVASVVIPAALFASSAIGTAFLWEIVKKTDLFKDTTDQLAKQTDKKLSISEKKFIEKQNALLKRITSLSQNKRELLTKVAELRPEFQWAKKQLKEISNPTPEEILSNKIRILFVAENPTIPNHRLTQNSEIELIFTDQFHHAINVMRDEKIDFAFTDIIFKHSVKRLPDELIPIAKRIGMDEETATKGIPFAIWLDQHPQIRTEVVILSKLSKAAESYSELDRVKKIRTPLDLDELTTLILEIVQK